MKKLIVTLIVATLLALPLSAMAMDAVTNAELEGVAGQAGVTIAFGGDSTTTVDFSAISWGDPDGLGDDASADNAGWLIIDGVMTIEQTIHDGDELTLDVATVDSGDTYTSGGVSIGGDITFIAVGLPDIETNIITPDTLTIGLGSTAGTISGTLGLLNLKDLTISQGTPSTLYIYAH